MILEVFSSLNDSVIPLQNSFVFRRFYELWQFIRLMYSDHYIKIVLPVSKA